VTKVVSRRLPQDQVGEIAETESATAEAEAA
jgi:hypothetical protein